MAIGVFLSPSSQPWNQCNFGDSEEEHMRLLANQIKTLFDKDNRFICKVCDEFFEMSENDRLYNAVLQSNAFYNANGGNCYHVALHTDAFNSSASGFSVFFIGTGSGKNLAEKVKNELSKISSWGCRSLREYPELYELRKTLASSILAENNFHDEINQAKWIHENIDNGKLSQVYYNAVCYAENLQPINVSAPTPTPTPIPTPTPTPIPANSNNEETWKKDLIQKCINLGLLEDSKWLAKVDDKIEVFAVCKMLLKVNDKIINMQKEKIDVSGIVKVALAEMDKKYKVESINVLVKSDG